MVTSGPCAEVKGRMWGTWCRCLCSPQGPRQRFGLAVSCLIHDFMPDLRESVDSESIGPAGPQGLREVAKRLG